MAVQQQKMRRQSRKLSQLLYHVSEADDLPDGSECKADRRPHPVPAAGKSCCGLDFRVEACRSEDQIVWGHKQHDVAPNVADALLRTVPFSIGKGVPRKFLN